MPPSPYSRLSPRRTRFILKRPSTFSFPRGGISLALLAVVDHSRSLPVPRSLQFALIIILSGAPITKGRAGIAEQVQVGRRRFGECSSGSNSVKGRTKRQVVGLEESARFGQCVEENSSAG
ncbi:hypothetical protein IE81DRAFT_27295 [Ceraceosorus guamensis]|uniref:Uncharacterized protein n=1 Tax=Ceraceosorus guamensis TaxID=1522189 RepID=A0A316VT71_9BASI|nr:hypothetical protein IE81DRAFT_27295 [Ceraceosorus guamensis]PWN39411.1 hypothetical protein IE81DRAFT_27295 [Ceraceosorus guamensis]